MDTGYTNSEFPSLVGTLTYLYHKVKHGLGQSLCTREPIDIVSEASASPVRAQYSVTILLCGSFSRWENLLCYFEKTRVTFPGVLSYSFYCDNSPIKKYQ